MAHGALGTDTGGSCRIPAAYCGIVGFKPTARRIPLDGGVPLSFTLDSYGPIARSVACCVTLDAVHADMPIAPVLPRPTRGLRLAVPETVALDELDPAVAAAFERALSSLSARGVLIERIAVPEFAEVAVLNEGGGFAAAESWAWHRALITRRADDYDPRVLVRIRRGEKQTAADYIDLLQRRRRMIHDFERRVAPYDALVMPTTAILPPRIDDLVADDAAYARANLLSLRNCTLINAVDGCAISLPMHREGDAPVGLMLAAAGGVDRRVFEIAAGIEAMVRD
jgi:aspartyl-tRNA(Asn)/glutamyl-tRNA(Gln) amidotransferase subunit A